MKVNCNDAAPKNSNCNPPGSERGCEEMENQYCGASEDDDPNGPLRPVRERETLTRDEPALQERTKQPALLPFAALHVSSARRYVRSINTLLKPQKFFGVVQLGGLEPPTSCSTDRRSNQLSYNCILCRPQEGVPNGAETRCNAALWQGRTGRQLHAVSAGDRDVSRLDQPIKSPGSMPGLFGGNALAGAYSEKSMSSA